MPTRLIALPFVQEFLETCLKSVQELNRETDNGSVHAETLDELARMLVDRDPEPEVRGMFRAWLDGFGENAKGASHD